MYKCGGIQSPANFELLSTNIYQIGTVYGTVYISVAEPELHHLVGTGSSSDNGIKHGKELKNDTICISL
jgi:hypothetical protein